MSEELNRIVTVKGEGVHKWDGKEYDLSQPVQVRLGVAKHWESVGATINITESPQANIPPRDIVNPLAEEGQGEAFQSLKRRGQKPKEG